MHFYLNVTKYKLNDKKLLDRKCARFSVATRSHEIFKNKVPERMNINKYEPTNYCKQ